MAETIVLAGNPLEMPEKIASEAITPGHLVEFVLSGGDAGQLRKHATASASAAPLFAIENLTPDRSVATTAVDTPYADGEQMRYVMARPGDQINAWVPANAAAVVVGDFLTSNGDGTLKKYAAQTADEGGTATYTIQIHAVVAIAAQALDNSSTAAVARLKVWAV